MFFKFKILLFLIGVKLERFIGLHSALWYKKLKIFIYLKRINHSKFYASFDVIRSKFLDLPIMNKSLFMKNFDSINTCGISYKQAFELAEKAEEKGLFPETYLDVNTLTLVSLTAIDGVDVYKVKVKEDSYRYYDAATGLLVRTEKSEEAQGQKMTSVQDLSDYREVNGVLFPYSQKITTGPQIIGLAASEIVVNDGVSAEDFK